MGFGITLGGGGGAGGPGVVSKVANAAARLALTPLDGDIVIQLDTDELYEWDATLALWLKIGGAGPLGHYSGYDQITGEVVSIIAATFVDTATQNFAHRVNANLFVTTTDVKGYSIITGIDGLAAATNYAGVDIGSTFGATVATVVNNIASFNTGNNYQANLTSNLAVGFNDNSQVVGAALTDLTAFNSSVVINTATMNQVVAFKTGMDIGTSATHLNGFTGLALYDQFRALADVDGYTGIAVSPSFNAGSVVDGYTGMTMYPQIDSIGLNGYRSIIVGGNFGQGAAATVNNHIDVQISPVYRTGSTLGSYQGIGVGPSFDLGSALTSITNIYMNPLADGHTLSTVANIASNGSFGSTTATTITNFYEANFNTNFNANTTIGDYIGLMVRPNTAVGSSITNNFTFMDFGINAPIPVGGSAKGISVNMTGLTTGAASQPQTFEGQGGAFSNNSPINTATFTPGVAFGNNSLAGQLLISAGFPITGVFGFGNNLGISVDAQDNMVADLFLGSSSLGYSINGFVNQVNIAAGVTFDTMNYMFAGGQASGTGTINNLSLFRAAGLVSPGLTITNEIQFHADAAVDGGAPTNLWAFRADSTNANNWFARNLVIGGTTMLPTNASIGLEIQGTTKALRHAVLTTAQKNALTALAGMEVYDTTLGRLEWYDGANWVPSFASGTYTLGSVIFAGVGGIPTQDNANFFWDDTNNRLGLGDATPAATLDVNGDQALQDANIATTGTITNLSTTARSSIRLTGAGAVTLQGIANGVDGKLLFLKNRTGNLLTIQDQNAGGAAADRIITGTGADLTVQDGQGLIFQYDGTTQRWQIMAASGGGVALQGTRAAGTSISAATQITPTVGKDTDIFIVGNAGPVTSTATSPLVTTSMIVGQIATIIGTSDTNTVTYVSTNTFVLNGTCTLGKDQSLRMKYMGSDGTNSSWVEIGRS